MSLPRLPSLEEVNIENKEIKSIKDTSEAKRGRPRIPKTEYNAQGIPVLAIPDLDDVNLNDEIDKYLGDYDEEDE